jgi:Polysaccharide pyruvyl transferase.
LDLLQPLTDKTITQVLDPTLLLKKEEWDRIAAVPEIKEKYVLVYQVRKDARTISFANQIAKQLGAVVIQLDTDVSYANFKNENIDEKAGPNEFVGWIKNAACVVTTSFHGTAFSLIYQKDFYSIMLPDGKNTRSISLLKAVGLESRMVEFSDNVEFSSIDYTVSEELLTSEVAKSSRFLLNALQS